VTGVAGALLYLGIIAIGGGVLGLVTGVAIASEGGRDDVNATVFPD
jgi:hypothetical protein